MTEKASAVFVEAQLEIMFIIIVVIISVEVCAEIALLGVIKWHFSNKDMPPLGMKIMRRRKNFIRDVI